MPSIAVVEKQYLKVQQDLVRGCVFSQVSKRTTWGHRTCGSPVLRLLLLPHLMLILIICHLRIHCLGLRHYIAPMWCFFPTRRGLVS